MIRKALALLGTLAALAFGQPAQAATTQIIGPANVTTAPLTVNGVPVCLQGDSSCPGGGGGGISSVTINGTNIQVTGSPCSSGACTFGLNVTGADVDAALGYTPCGAASLTGGAYTNANVTVNAAGCVTAIANGSSGAPGGSNGQPQYNNGGVFGGFTPGGDVTFSVPNFTVVSIGGVTPGPFYAGTNAANLTGTAPNAIIPPPTLSALGGAEAIACASHFFIDALSTSGLLACAQPAFSDLTGSVNCSQLPALTGDTTTPAGSCVTSTTKTGGVAFAASATTDTTNATNITSGTLPSGRLPTPGPSTLGGIESITCGTSHWIDLISTGGVPACAQPAFGDISGSLALSQFPSIANDTILANISGSTGVPAANTVTAVVDTLCSTNGDVLERISGTWQCATPAGGTVTVTGSPASGNLAKFSGPTSITNGDLSGDVTTSGGLATTLATVNSSPGSTTCSNVTTNGKGLVTANSNGSCSPGAIYSTPTLGSFTGVNLSTSTTTQTVSGQAIFFSILANTSLNWRLLTIAAPSTPFKVRVQIKSAQQVNASAQTAGLYFTNGTKLLGIESLTLSTAAYVRVQRITNVTTDGTTVFTGPTSWPAFTFYDPTWYQIRDDGTTLWFDVSFDGQNFTNLYSEAVGAWLTPTTVGWGGVNQLSGGSDVVDLLNWTTYNNANLDYLILVPAFRRRRVANDNSRNQRKAA